MGDVVNLRRARKRKAREHEQAAAAARRVESGVSRAERGSATAERALADRRLAGHHLGSASPEPADDGR